MPTVAQEDAAEETPAEPAWAGKVSVGGSLSRGNVNSIKGVVEATAERVFDPHLVRLGALAAYGENQTSGAGKTVDNDKQEITEYYRYSFSESIFAYVDSLQGRDSVQGIKFRFLGNFGPGWRAWHMGDKQFLDLETGVGYRYEHRIGKGNDIDGANARFAATYANLLGPAEFRQTGEFLLPFDDTSGWLAKARTALSFPLTTSWSFENALLIEYNNRPAASAPAGTGFLNKFELDYIVSLVYLF